MNEQIKKLLAGESENHIFPFFWQHGEDEETLRRYMKAIDEVNCKAVCVESRPHPAFCQDKWWEDMDVILDEARKRNMKVWILDDSHFPTGFANGAVKKAPISLHRQSICGASAEFGEGEQEVRLDVSSMIPPEWKPASMIEQFVYPSQIKDAPHFDDDEIISITVIEKATGNSLTLPVPEKGQPLVWQKPAGVYRVWVVGLSRNCGPHREYINMLDPDSCRILIDAVYEPHYQHYAADFGKTIEGFFSDEPELGNGHMYYYENYLGTDQDLPFSAPLKDRLEERLGSDWLSSMYLLWDNDGDPKKTAALRYAYMDELTKLVRQSFSRQLGDWCHEHGVRYIGHMIEDSNAHTRTGSSLGHYFRGLDGQDMSGIDDIGGQVYPQGEEEPKVNLMGSPRDGEFYHFQMGNLAASAAGIQPGKAGNAMCEIFGNYGWTEGPTLEKYLADHFMVRGINHFVPHAFSPAPYPDTDCPPHFYAQGNNPQYRAFGKLIAYMNRVTTLTCGGHRIAPVAVLYHGEAEWAGKAMLSQKVGRLLYENQIEFDTVPSDIFAEPAHYHTVLGNPLRVNTQEYKAFIVPYCEYLTKETALGLGELLAKGLEVIFIDALPIGISNGDDALLEQVKDAAVLPLSDLIPHLDALEVRTVNVQPASSYLRVMHYVGKADLYYFVNEAAKTYEGTVQIPGISEGYLYDAMENKVYAAPLQGDCLHLYLEPEKAILLILGEADPEVIQRPAWPEGEAVELKGWVRSICPALEYPAFSNQKAVTLPDDVSQELPAFSGFVRYETSICLNAGRRAVLEITGDEAVEAAELFVNGVSAGIQLVSPLRYDITKMIRDGENVIAVEIATTLERQSYELTKDNAFLQLKGLQPPVSPTGLHGMVKLYS